MRRTKEMQWRCHLLAGVVTIAMVLLLAMFAEGFSIVSHAESAAKVIAASANIRKEPNPSSQVIGSTERDKVISIKSQVQGTDGYTWYEVYVDSNTLGYIRSDLVQITDGTTPPAGSAPAASTAPPAATEPSSVTSVPDEPLVAVTAVNPVSASVTNDVRVRQNASTTSRILDSVKSGMELTIIGTATGTDDVTWYQVTLLIDGAEATGFVRSDYISVSEELIPYTEEPSAEDPTTNEPPADTGDPAPSTTEGYGTVLQNDQWMLVDYEGKHAENPGEGFVIEDLFKKMEEYAKAYSDVEGTVKTQKIIIILLVILLVGAAAAITLLIFKVKDMSDTQYFNEVENETLRRRGTKPQGGSQKVMQKVGNERQSGRTAGTRGGAAQSQRPQGSRPGGAAQGQRPQGQRPGGAAQGQRPAAAQGQRPQGSRPSGAVQGQQSQAAQSQQRPVAQGARPGGPAQGQQSQAAQGQQRPAPQGARPAGASQGQQRPAAQGQRPQGNRPAQGQPSPGWQSKNFMADEDEFEFEFLNYDGDDQK